VKSATNTNAVVLQDVLRQKIEQHGGVRAAARVLQISAAYLSRLSRGEKIWPDDKLLKKLRVRRSVIYWRLGEPQVEDPPELL
jgi:hypothetical protein